MTYSKPLSDGGNGHDFESLRHAQVSLNTGEEPGRSFFHCELLSFSPLGSQQSDQKKKTKP